MGKLMSQAQQKKSGKSELFFLCMPHLLLDGPFICVVLVVVLHLFQFFVVPAVDEYAYTHKLRRDFKQWLAHLHTYASL